MTIQLNPEQERMIQEEIRRGHFHSPGEVVDYALAALREKGKASGQTQILPCKSLVDVLSTPPFAGSELNLDRQGDLPRPIDL